MLFAANKFASTSSVLTFLCEGENYDNVFFNDRKTINMQPYIITTQNSLKLFKNRLFIDKAIDTFWILHKGELTFLLQLIPEESNPF